MKKTIDVVRAWKDDEYRLSLTPEQRRELPDSPVGMVELADSELHGVTGACFSGAPCTTLPSYQCRACFTC